MKKVLYIAVIILLVLWWSWRQLFTPVDTDRQPVSFSIQRSQEFADVLENLKEKDLTKNSFVLSMYARFKGFDRTLKAGRYDIDPTLSPAEIIAFLSKPSSGELTVTIPEGYSIYEIDQRLMEMDLIEKGEFVAWAKVGNAEGHLFPDTYFVSPAEFSVGSFGKLMKRTFEQKVVKDLQKDIKENQRTLEQVIIMASILEKEVRHAEDAPIVAGILWKRLDSGWALQTDATVLYGLDDRSKISEKLKEDSDYNTYTRKGLPAGPIGNPGLLMIKAVLYPEASPYWFYLTAEDGNAVYATTLEQHKENINKHL